VRAPAIIVEFPLEGPVVVRMAAMTEEEQVRLLDWINDGRPEYAELVLRALELERETRAA
jgi:hypothetical protein